MALPLIMMAGAGILSGAQYLMNRGDEREGASMLSDFRDANYNDPYYQQYGADYEALAQDRGFFDTSNVDRTQAMQELYLRNRQNFEAQKQIDQLEAQKQGNTYQKQLNADYTGRLQRFSEVQKAYEKAANSLGDDATAFDKISSLYNFFALVDPGRAVQGNEAAMFDAGGGMTATAENWIRSIFGKGLGELSQQQILKTLDKQFAPEYDAAQRQRSFFDREQQKFFQQGYDVRSPEGVLGVDWNDWSPGQTRRRNPGLPEGAQEGWGTPK